MIGAITALALGVEQAIIVGAVVLDTTSHFNVSTPAHAAAWSTMAASIVLVWVMNLLAMILLLRQRLVSRAFAWGLRLGLVASFVGMGVAFFMTAATPEQLAVAGAGGGLPSWAPTASASPTAASGCRSSAGARSGVICARRTSSACTGSRPCRSSAGCCCAARSLAGRGRPHRARHHRGHGYIAVVAALTWQALRGQPLIAPDAWMLAALGVIVGTAGIAGVGVLANARRRRVG